jgi:hypothetical protein
MSGLFNADTVSKIIRKTYRCFVAFWKKLWQIYWVWRFEGIFMFHGFWGPDIAQIHIININIFLLQREKICLKTESIARYCCVQYFSLGGLKGHSKGIEKVEGECIGGHR